MQYKVLRAVEDRDWSSFGNSFNQLEEKVNRAIADGWKPIGGVSITEGTRGGALSNTKTYVVAQAMVKED